MVNLIVLSGFGQLDSVPKGFLEKPLSFRLQQLVPQTDTGSQGENPKVLELITAKELGKMVS